MKKILATIVLVTLMVLFLPIRSRAAGGIYASGGGSKTVGQSFTVSVSASGATFDTFEATISVSGPVSVTSFNYGDATYVGAKPANGVHFVGTFLGEKKTSFSVATIKLKATGVGNGAVSVSSVALKSGGSVTGSGSGNANFSIAKAPELPGAPAVSSSSHPDQNAAYEATTIALTWTKDSGVDNFSYLLDQTANTTPPAKTTDANTAATYPDKPIGTYYFHIRAHKPDGWGGTTHFKITIKEPDAKIDETISKPSDIEIKKAELFTNNIKEGTVTGIIISGKTEPGFTANFTLLPALTLPEGKTLTALADETGRFELLLDFPIPAGFHKVTIQGQKEKVLTPISDEITFEISQAKGGKINILTSDDELTPVEAVKSETTKWYSKIDKKMLVYGAIILVLIAIIVVAYFGFRKHIRKRDLFKSFHK